MPIYEYACSCGNRFQTFKSKYDPDKKRKCPVCKKMAKKVISMATPEKQNVRLSRSMGIRQQDVPVAVKRWPGSEYTNDGTGFAKLVIHGRSEKNKRTKERGLTELD